MKIINSLTIILVILAIMVPLSTLTTNHHLIRNKRGLSDFFKRFWNIRKKINYFPFQAALYPTALGQDYLLSQASNFYPLYQLNPASQTYSPFQQAQPHSVQQIYGGEGPANNQPNPMDLQQQSVNMHHQQPQQQQQSNMANFYYQQQQTPQTNMNQQYSNSNYQQVQPDESIQKPSYYYPNQHQLGYIGTSPYTFHSNPSQANTFRSRPYGSNPGTIDVHQVLDEFIRSAGLSPHGDHENANKDRAYSEDNKALSVKKLYSYPFYFSSSGDRPTSIRRQSIDEEALVNNSTRMKNSGSLSPIKLEPINQPVMSDESSFIAKNAAALQEFLANKADVEQTG